MTIDRDWADDRELDIVGSLLFLWRARYPILGVTVASALIAFGAMRLMPREYTAVSTVFVAANVPAGDLLPDPLNPEAVSHLAESDGVQSAVDAQLRDHSSGEGHIVRRSPVVYSTGDAAKPYLPMMGLSVTATSPTLARDAANAWADVLVRQDAKLEAGTINTDLKAMTDSYDAEVKRLVAEERALEQQRQSAGPSQQAEIAARRRELDSGWRNLRQIGGRLSEAQVVDRARGASVRNGSEAELPTTPSGPRSGRLVIIAAVLGFLIASAGAAVAARLHGDTRAAAPLSGRPV